MVNPWDEGDSLVYFKIVGFYDPRIPIFYKMVRFKNEEIQQNTLLKKEILINYENIKENKKIIKHKQKYIKRGLNNIIVSITVIIFFIMFMLLGRSMVIL